MSQAISSEASAQLYSSPALMTKATLTTKDGKVRDLTGADLTAFSYDQATSSDQSFDVGGAVMGKLTVGLQNHDRTWDKLDFTGATIDASVGVSLLTNDKTIGNVYAVQVPTSNGTVTRKVHIEIYEGSNGHLTSAVFDDGQQLDDGEIAKLGTLVWYSGGKQVATGTTCVGTPGVTYECRLEG